jgi:hypothetical protein
LNSKENTVEATTRIVACRYTKTFGNLCTAEAVDPDAEILLCTTHLAQAMRLLTAAQVRIAGKANR